MDSRRPPGLVVTGPFRGGPGGGGWGDVVVMLALALTVAVQSVRLSWLQDDLVREQSRGDGAVRRASDLKELMNTHLLQDHCHE